MELNELDTHEKTVLAAGLKLTVLADHRATEQEAEVIGRVARELGQAEYMAAMERADFHASDAKAFEGMAAGVHRVDARELIYGTLLDAALADSVSPGDNPLMDALGRMWGITVRITGSEEETMRGVHPHR